MASLYWKNIGKTDADRRTDGRTFDSTYGLSCAECCNGDECDDPTHYDRDSCPYCLGTGAIPSPAYLAAKKSIAADMFRDGKIGMGEMLRHEVDAALGENSGPIKPAEPKGADDGV